MTIPSNYTNLVQAVQEELEDTGSPFVTYIPTAIRMAENRINKAVDGLFQNASTTINVPVGVSTLTKPIGYRFAYNLFLRQSNGVRSILKKMPLDFLTDYWPIKTSQAKPKYYADNNLTTFEVAPTADSAYTIEINYAAYPTPLSPSVQTNAVIEKYPDLLWYATLIEQATFARMFEAQALYDSKYQERLAQVQEETRRERADNTYQVATQYVVQNRLNKQG